MKKLKIEEGIEELQSEEENKFPTILSYLDYNFKKPINYNDSAQDTAIKKKVMIKKKTEVPNNQNLITSFFKKPS